MGHRSHRSTARKVRALELHERRHESLRADWVFLVLQPYAKCSRQDVHTLCVACAEAEFIDGYYRDVVLDGWDAVKLPKLGVGIAHEMACGCTIVSIESARWSL